MSNVVEAIINTDFFDTPLKSSNAQAQEQEVKDCTEFLKIEYQKYKKYKIIFEGIEECIEDDNIMDEDLRHKIKNIILGESVSQIKLSDNSNEATNETVLGVPLVTTELSYTESNRLLSCLRSKLDSKSNKLKNECLSLLDRDINEFGIEQNESPLDLTPEDLTLLGYKTKLVAEQDCYIKNQFELLELLEELKNIRIKTVPEVTNRKIEECSLRSRINYLKCHLAKDKCRLDIFMETSNSLKAYTEVIKDMKQQRESLKVEIEQLKDLKKKYADVACKEYDDILKSYLQYKSSFEKKKMMYELYG